MNVNGTTNIWETELPADQWREHGLSESRSRNEAAAMPAAPMPTPMVTPILAPDPAPVAAHAQAAPGTGWRDGNLRPIAKLEQEFSVVARKAENFSPQLRAYLDGIAGQARAQSSPLIEVVGYSRNLTGTAGERAYAVRDYLAAAGVDPRVVTLRWLDQPTLERDQLVYIELQDGARPPKPAGYGVHACEKPLEGMSTHIEEFGITDIPHPDQVEIPDRGYRADERHAAPYARIADIVKGYAGAPLIEVIGYAREDASVAQRNAREVRAQLSAFGVRYEWIDVRGRVGEGPQSRAVIRITGVRKPQQHAAASRVQA